MEEIKINNTNKNSRIVYFDILNIIACLAVCYLHCNGGVHSFSNTRFWKESLVIEVLCYFAVPIFIMLSGATLLKYKERYTTKQYFKKRIEKILLPWIIWSLIVYIEAIYWFFPLILYLYCLIPVISILTEEKYRKLAWGIVSFIFIIQSVIQTIFAMLNIEFPTILSYMTEQNSYIIYLLLGYLLSTTKLDKKTRILIYVLAIMALVTRYSYTMIASINDRSLNRASWGYTAFTGVLPTLAVFIFVKNVKWEAIWKKVKIKPTYISKIASCSFGVYLIYMLVKGKMVSVFGINTQSYFYRLIFPIILYVICVIVVTIIKKIPILKKIVP